MSAVSHTAGLTNIAYAPLIQNYNYNLISGQAVQNAGWDPARQDIHYYNQLGDECSPAYALSPIINPYYAWMVTAPPGSPCSPVISARLARWSVTSGYVVGNVNQSLPGTGTFAEYHAIANPSQTVTVPFWHNGQDEWTSGVAIQNVNDRYVSGFVDYYWSTQGLFTYESFTLAPHETRLYVNTPTGLGWTGTVRIWADAPVAVVSNFTRNAADGLMSEAGVHK